MKRNDFRAGRFLREAKSAFLCAGGYADNWGFVGLVARLFRRLVKIVRREILEVK